MKVYSEFSPFGSESCHRYKSHLGRALHSIFAVITPTSGMSRPLCKATVQAQLNSTPATVLKQAPHISPIAHGFCRQWQATLCCAALPEHLPPAQPEWGCRAARRAECCGIAPLTWRAAEETPHSAVASTNSRTDTCGTSASRVSLPHFTSQLTRQLTQVIDIEKTCRRGNIWQSESQHTANGRIQQQR